MATAPSTATDTRERVLQATVDCILEEGFYRASSNRIAKRAGVTWGVIQYHFGTREALLVETFKASMHDLLDTLERAEISGDTFDERLESLADIVWGFYRQPKFVAYEQLTLNLTHDPQTAPDTLATMNRLNSRIGRRFSQLVDETVAGPAAVVLPAGALLQVLRGVAIGLTLVEANPSTARSRRSRVRGAEPERALLLAALRALVAQEGYSV